MYYNSSETVRILDEITTNIYRLAFSVMVIFGLIGHILNMILFTRPKLISNSCCNYCLASSCVSVIQILFGQLFRLLKGGFHISLATLWWCRVRVFFLYTAYLTSTTLVLFASIDRYVSSSYRVKYRRWASINVARRLIPMVIFIASLCQLHILFVFVVDRYDENECWAPKDTGYRLAFDIAFLIIHGLIFPILMSTFGFLTIYNIRQRRSSCQINVKSNVKRHRIRDFQRMILVQTVCVISFTLPLAIHQLHRTLTRSHWKSSEQLAWERLTMCLVRLLWFFHDSAAFYIYSLSSVKFRRELFQFLDEHRLRRTRRAQTTTTLLELSVGKKEQGVEEIDIETTELKVLDRHV